MNSVAAARQRRLIGNSAGFTLAEVIITMFLISMMCLSVFAAMQQITKATLALAIRSEGYRLMQSEAERLLSIDYTSFTSSGNQTITSAVKTTYTPSSDAALSLPADNALGRATFTRRVVAVSNTATSKTLRVEVEWTWQGHSNLISTPLFRTQ